MNHAQLLYKRRTRCAGSLADPLRTGWRAPQTGSLRVGPAAIARSGRAIAHAPHWLLACALALAGCAEPASEAASRESTPTPPAAVQPASAPASGPSGRAAQLEALIRDFTPPAKDVTSDNFDVWIRARKTALHAHATPDPEFGRACWTAYRERAELPFDVRRDLLEVAARTDAAGMRDHLVAEFEAYGGELGLRARAIDLLAELDPPRALELLEPLVREPRKSKTWPPQETLLSAWNEAALRAGIERSELLGAVAADLLQDDPARHLAVRQLGTCGDARAAQALEGVLVESTGNGYLRRLAAQSLSGDKRFTQACATLRRVLEREADENFAQFLDSLVRKNCP
jgi:hypothetical protein